jgi:hypothetical protein
MGATAPTIGIKDLCDLFVIAEQKSSENLTQKLEMSRLRSVHPIASNISPKMILQMRMDSSRTPRFWWIHDGTYNYSHDMNAQARHELDWYMANLQCYSNLYRVQLSRRDWNSLVRLAECPDLLVPRQRCLFFA